MKIICHHKINHTRANLSITAWKRPTARKTQKNEKWSPEIDAPQMVTHKIFKTAGAKLQLPPKEGQSAHAIHGGLLY
jgi:hypothetical protein